MRQRGKEEIRTLPLCRSYWSSWAAMNPHVPLQQLHGSSHFPLTFENCMGSFEAWIQHKLKTFQSLEFKWTPGSILLEQLFFELDVVHSSIWVSRGCPLPENMFGGILILESSGTLKPSQIKTRHLHKTPEVQDRRFEHNFWRKYPIQSSVGLYIFSKTIIKANILAPIKKRLSNPQCLGDPRHIFGPQVFINTCFSSRIWMLDCD